MSLPCACLVVLDGWGIAPPGPGNAVSLAQTPVFDELWATYPHRTLDACGASVGLPDGQMGNSEVGHLNLGAGAVVMQDLTRIDAAVADGTLAANAVLREAMEAARRVHLVGLVSDGGVHSSLDHLFALMALAQKLAVEDLVVHCITDGRDTLPHAGAGFVEQVQERRIGRVASVIGRYYAMDRDSRWDRTQLAVDALVDGRAEFHAGSAVEAVRAAYERGETDEFIRPTLVGEEGRIRASDSVICFNFRPDRVRQLTTALGPVARRYTCLTEYEEGWPYPVAFPPARPEVTLAQVVAAAGSRQLHVAETEKYPHVTYFLNGGVEEPYGGERRELVPSPRDVATYDERPSMSASAAADAFVAAWREDSPRLGVINFANADMVGHSGVIPAAVEAVETVDACLGRIVEAVHASGGACVICADHGNADNMLEPDGSPNTAHSLNPVPLIVTRTDVALRDGAGVLADVAPTLLELLGMDVPAAMTGRSLLAR